MSGKLSGKVALITGGSRGIGRVTAKLFAEEGARVCINYSRSGEAAAGLARAIEAVGGEALLLQGDVSKEVEVKTMVEEAFARFGSVDVLVNNAGILHLGDLFTLKDEDIDMMFGVNVKGIIYCTREVCKRMIEQGKRGRIVNVTSIAGMGTAYKGTTGYALTKAAVTILTKRLAFELGEAQINVNCVAPGYIDTEINSGGKTKEEFEQVSRNVSARTMLNRIGRPEEIARAILFLASEDSDFITGQTLVVDGGRMDFLSHSF